MNPKSVTSVVSGIGLGVDIATFMLIAAVYLSKSLHKIYKAISNLKDNVDTFYFVKHYLLANHKVGEELFPDVAKHFEKQGVDLAKKVTSRIDQGK